MMDKKDIISKLADYKLEGDIEGREKSFRWSIGVQTKHKSCKNELNCSNLFRQFKLRLYFCSPKVI